MLYYIYVITSLDHQARVKFLCLVTLMFNNLEKLTVLHTSEAMALLVPTWTTSSELLSPHSHGLAVHPPTNKYADGFPESIRKRV